MFVIDRQGGAAWFSRGEREDDAIDREKRQGVDAGPNRPSTRKAVADGCVPMSLGAARPPGTCLGVTERCHFPELQRERDVFFGLCASCVCNTYINRFRSGADF